MVTRVPDNAVVLSRGLVREMSEERGDGAL
jgi:hypothetical protein